MDTTLTEAEEKSLIGMLYNHVSFGTTLQVFGEAGAEEGRIASARSVLRKLLLKYGLLASLSPEELLILGLVADMSEGELARYVEGGSAHLKLRAEYFTSTER